MRGLLAGICSASLVLTGCGGGQQATTKATTTAASSTGASTTTTRAQVRVTISSPTHAPKVNVPWPVRITATDGSGKPVTGTLTMRVLFGGQPVGKIDKGAVYHFVGTWQERPGNEITWPPASRGQPLTFQVVVKARGLTIRKNWAIRVS